MSEQELLRSYQQKVAELQAELVTYQRIVDLVGSQEATAVLARAESRAPLPRGSQEAEAAPAHAARPAPTAAGSQEVSAVLAGAGAEFSREILEHLTDGFAQVRSDGTLSYYNRAFAQLLSLPADMPDTLHLMDLEHLSTCEPFAAALKAVLGGAPQYAQCTLTDTQGHRRVVECAATAVHAGGNAFTAALVIRDQTERELLLAHLTALNTVATALTRSLDFDQRLGFALAACREATAADAALIYLINEDRQTLSLARADGFSADSIAALQAAPLQMEQRLPAIVALDGAARVVAELQDESTLHPELVQRERLVSGAFVALRDAHEITGVLAIYTHGRRLFTKADIRLLTSIASQVGLSLYNARLHEQVLQQAQYDGLTGLFNRGHLMDQAEREYQRARRHRSPLIALMIDVDQFKAVNDTSGHVAGDQTLQAVARMLREQTRTFDLVGRYGGDEFVVLLVDCTHAYAFEVIRRLHQAALAIHVPTDQGRLMLSLSVGMAACKLTEGETLEQVLAEADRAMYAFKNRTAPADFSLPAMG